MNQFIHGSDAAYADLEQQARTACVVFADQEMPAGTEPELARVGFEIQPDNGRATLFVDRGLTYTGPSHPIWEWLITGEKCFRSFGDLVDWIRRELATGYRSIPPGLPGRGTDTEEAWRGQFTSECPQ